MAITPTPQYINYTDNVYPLIGSDKILVADDDSTAISISEANQLIASGESIVVEDLSPYYVTDPALITTTNGGWETLPRAQYTFLYNMFVYQACVQLIRGFIQRNTDKAHTLDGFSDYYELEYTKYFNRITHLLPNGGYKYQLSGLKTLNTGIPRIPQRNAAGGLIGGCNDYVGRQLINPQQNYASGLPFWNR